MKGLFIGALLLQTLHAQLPDEASTDISASAGLGISNPEDLLPPAVASFDADPTPEADPSGTPGSDGSADDEFGGDDDPELAPITEPGPPVPGQPAQSNVGGFAVTDPTIPDETGGDDLVNIGVDVGAGDQTDTEDQMDTGDQTDAGDQTDIGDETDTGDETNTEAGTSDDDQTDDVDNLVDDGEGQVDETGDQVDDGEGTVDEGDNQVDDGEGFVDEGDDQVDNGEGFVDEGDDQVDNGDDQVDDGEGFIDEGDDQVDNGDDQVDDGEGFVDEGDDVVDDSNSTEEENGDDDLDVGNDETGDTESGDETSDDAEAEGEGAEEDQDESNEEEGGDEVEDDLDLGNGEDGDTGDEVTEDQDDGSEDGEDAENADEGEDEADTEDTEDTDDTENTDADAWTPKIPPGFNNNNQDPDLTDWDGEDNSWYDGEDISNSDETECPEWCQNGSSDDDDEPALSAGNKGFQFSTWASSRLRRFAQDNVPSSAGLRGFIWPSKPQDSSAAAEDTSFPADSSVTPPTVISSKGDYGPFGQSASFEENTPYPYDSPYDENTDYNDDGDDQLPNWAEGATGKGGKKGKRRVKKGRGRCPIKCYGGVKPTWPSVAPVATETTPSPPISSASNPDFTVAPAPTTLLTSTQLSSTKSKTPRPSPSSPVATSGSGAGTSVGTESSTGSGTGVGAGGQSDVFSDSSSSTCPNQCYPFDPAKNYCDSATTGCVTTGGKNYYCACRAGYRYDGANPNQFKVPGQPYVYGSVRASCNTPCSDNLCSEVPVRAACV